MSVLGVAQPDTPCPGLRHYYPLPGGVSGETMAVDICVYGGTPGGVAAAAQAQRIGKSSVVDGAVVAEGCVEVAVPVPYPVSCRALLPKAGQCENLLVPVAVSSSHVAFGSIRMEPVFMILGQSAATAASLAIDAGCSVQEVNYARLRDRLLQDGQKLAS